MAALVKPDRSLKATVDAVVKDLVRASHNRDSSYVSLPLIYPGGSSVTLKIDRTAHGLRVSDNGFGFRELEAVGADSSFARAASRFVADDDLALNKRAIFVDVPDEDQLLRAICDVGSASWRTVDAIYARLPDETEIEDYLRERLQKIFGERDVTPDAKVVGASTTEWAFSASVRHDGHVTIFHAVSEHANSVYRTSTAFHDIAALDNPPSLVAVVKSLKAMGSKLGILSQAGRVMEEDQPDATYLQAAA